MKQTVLITGASTGIGRAMAEVFAKNGYDLILVARNEVKLSEAKEKLTKDYGCLVHIIVKDLSNPKAAEVLYNEVAYLKIKVDVLINNAGFGICGLFHETKQDANQEMIDLNISTLTALTSCFSKDMVKRGKGKILNVASTGSYQPGPYTSVYYATKAYVLSLSEAIYRELKPFGVKVYALCPGATESEFAKRAGKTDPKHMMTAMAVANYAYKGIQRNKPVIVPGVVNKLGVLLSKFIPRQWSARAVANYQKKLLTGTSKES